MTGPRRLRSRLAVGLTAVLLLQVAMLAIPDLAAASVTRTMAITESTANPPEAWGHFDGNPPVLYDINGDGTKEIIGMNDNGHVYVLDPRTGAMLADLVTHFPPNWGARSINGPAVSPMTQGGVVNIVVANSAAVITDFKFDPAHSNSSHFAFTKVWSRHPSACHKDPGMDARPVLADLDQDGHLDVVVNTEETGIYALNGRNGTTMWQRCIGGGNAAPGIADVNGDGWPDVVDVSDAGEVTALRGTDGGWLWQVNLLDHLNLGSASIPVSPGVGQLDGKGGQDVVVGARDSHDPNNWSNDHAALVAISGNGKILWSTQPANADPLTYTRPIIVDANHDGSPEVYWGTWNTVGHKPPFGSGAWARTGPGAFYRVNGTTGQVVWSTILPTWWSNKDLAIADVNGDGVQDVLANGPNNGHDGLWVLNSNTGAKESFVDVYPWKVQRQPVVGDVYGKGTMQFVVPVSPMDANKNSPGFLVYDTGQPMNAAWPHLPEPQIPSAPGQMGAFAATFTVHNSGPHWQQLTVKPDDPHRITSARVRIDGGVWEPMKHSSYGAWTSSYPTPKGSRVQFRVIDAYNMQSTSHAFTWMEGNGTQRSLDTGFHPRFQPSKNINAWWVEMWLRLAHAARVEVSIDGGAWVALAFTSWGSWAKSMHVPKGSNVVFRAVDAQGDVATSGAFAWMESWSGFHARFTPHAQGNAWWVETAVSHDHPLARVQVSLDGGPWQSLHRTSWGTWAKSVHVPSGTSVRFRATSTDGAWIVSGTYRW